MLKQKKFKDIKSLINLAIVRINNVRKKTSQELSVKKRLLAKHLQEGEYALARLEAERIVKLDWKVEAMNIIEIKCEEVRDNVPLLQNQKDVPGDLFEAVATIIYSEQRASIPELKQVVKVLKKKYGEEFIMMNVNDGAKRVEERLISRLSGQRPNAYLVYSYMKEIAAAFGIEFIDDDVTRKLGERFDVPMTAGTAGVSSASGIGSSAYAVTDGRILPKGQKPKGFVPPTMDDFPEEAPPPKRNDKPKPGAGGGSGGGGAKAPAAAKPKSKPAAKPAQKKESKPTPKPVKKDDGMSDLMQRFNKLQDL